MSSTDDKGPPAEHRFKPGQSGNPKGRPKGAKNKKNRPPKLRGNPMDEKVSYVVDGKSRRITRTEALVRSARDRALKAKNTTLASLLLDLTESLAQAETQLDYDDWYVRLHSVADYSWDHPEGLLMGMNMVRILYKDHPLARMALEPWLVEFALARLPENALTREQQMLVLAATRMAHTVNFPHWWDRYLRKRRRGGYQLLLDEEIRWNGGERI